MNYYRYLVFEYFVQAGRADWSISKINCQYKSATDVLSILLTASSLIGQNTLELCNMSLHIDAVIELY